MWQEMAQYKTNPEKHLSWLLLSTPKTCSKAHLRNYEKKSPRDEIPKNSTQNQVTNPLTNLKNMEK